MAYTKAKPARDADHLLSKLKARKLTVSDFNEEIQVKHYIRTIGYYRLSGYFGPHEKQKDEFKDGITIHDIHRLYEFDRRLRLMTFAALKKIELEVRAVLTDRMSLSHESDWYEKDDLFILTETMKVTITECQIEEDSGRLFQQDKQITIPKYNEIKKEILKGLKKNETKEYIVEFKKKYGEMATVPSWMMMECISFGALSRLYALIKDCHEKKLVAQHFGVMMPDVFTSWLHGFAILRNTCAHHARIWNRKLTNDLKLPKKKSAQFLDNLTPENLRKFYGIGSCMLFVLYKISPDEAKQFKEDFFKLTQEHAINIEAMGFPNEFMPNDIWKS